MICPHCRNVIQDGATFCPVCQNKIDIPPQNNGYYQPPQQPNQFAQTPPQYVMAYDPGESSATIAMICGILSFVAGFIPAIIAIIFGNKYNSEGNGMNASKARAGKICGWVTIGINIAVIVLYILFFVFMGIAGSTISQLG